MQSAGPSGRSRLKTARDGRRRNRMDPAVQTKGMGRTWPPSVQWTAGQAAPQTAPCGPDPRQPQPQLQASGVAPPVGSSGPVQCGPPTMGSAPSVAFSGTVQPGGLGFQPPGQLIAGVAAPQWAPPGGPTGTPWPMEGPPRPWWEQQQGQQWIPGGENGYGWTSQQQSGASRDWAADQDSPPQWDGRDPARNLKGYLTALRDWKHDTAVPRWRCGSRLLRTMEAGTPLTNPALTTCLPAFLWCAEAVLSKARCGRLSPWCPCFSGEHTLQWCPPLKAREPS